MTRTISALLLSLLAGPALAQSQGDTGVGAALDQAQTSIADLRKQFDQQWNGDAGRLVKGGIGAAGIAAALLSAREALYGDLMQGRVTVSGGKVKVTPGAPDDDDDMGPVTTGTATATTGSTP